MYKIYFKQAWALIRQERLFSAVYIIGTGLSISMVMVLSILFYLKIAPIYPETSRDRMLVAKGGTLFRADGGQMSGALSLRTVDRCFEGVEGVEAIGLTYQMNSDYFIQPEGEREQLSVVAKSVNTGFWKVYPFRFAGGKPFSEADERSGIATAVLARSLAAHLFGDAGKAVGNYISLNFRPYRVCGVVEDGSFILERSFAQLWIPYTACPEYGEDTFDKTGVLGQFRVAVTTRPGSDLDAVREEVVSNARRYGQTLGTDSLSLNGQPDKHWQTVFRQWNNVEPDFTRELWAHGLVLLVFLLVPAVSLSGMADSRMERRLGEMGVRRAFGAPVGTLMGQVFSENLLFTILGGVVGLLFSFLLIYGCRGWIMEIALGGGFSAVPPEGMEVMLTPEMLLNYTVFGIALAVCLVLNLLSSFIPAWRAAHRQIVDSLNVK